MLVVVIMLGACSWAWAAPRVLLLGDSWAGAMWTRNTFARLFADPAFSASIPAGSTAKGDVTTVNGGTAYDWQDPARLALLGQELASNPTIDIVHVSLGGNDFLSTYKTSDTPEQRSAKFDSIIANLRTVIEYAVAQRPNIRVAVCDYDYLNFVESVAKPYDPIITQMYNDLGQPTPAQINGALVELGQRKLALCNSIPRCYYIHNFGLMHYVYGYPGFFAAGAKPYPGQPPAYTPFPGGDVNYPNPPVAMNVVTKSGTNYVDPIHLSETGYFYLGWNCMTSFYVSWLNNPLPLDTTPPVITLLGSNPATAL
ncbi:MAG TPA: SGNH/GDSL hydrolase family protein, partial [Candidatus Hydrogenedentes bacterium]|nr:SGNH/GDSL hydrolase family protein [Candidatus Hydrogenedentota bacterium]